MKHIMLFSAIFFLTTHCVVAQVMKRSLSKPVAAEAIKPFSVLPPALAFARVANTTYQWGEIISEKDGLLTVNFWDGWGRCVISEDGKVLSSTGNFNMSDTMVVVDIMEGQELLNNPTFQSGADAVARLALYVNKRYHYVSFIPLPAWPSSLRVFPVAHNHTKSITMGFSQNKWIVTFSELPEFVKGSEVSAVYYYTHKKRNFLTR